MGTTVTAVVVDAHPLLRDKLARQLGASAQIRVLGEASTGCDAVELISGVQPDVALVGFSLLDTDCLTLVVRAVQQGHPSTRVLVLSGSQHGPALADATENGVAARLSPDVSGPELVKAVLALHAHRVPALDMTGHVSRRSSGPVRESDNTL